MPLLTYCQGLPGRPCTNLVPRGRCPSCAPEWERIRRPSSNTRGYDADWRRRVAAAIAAEPWCHWPSGCRYEIDERNPLTGDHPVARAAGGSTLQEPVILCRRHNAAKGRR